LTNVFCDCIVVEYACIDTFTGVYRCIAIETELAPVLMALVMKNNP